MVFWQSEHIIKDKYPASKVLVKTTTETASQYPLTRESVNHWEILWILFKKLLIGVIDKYI